MWRRSLSDTFAEWLGQNMSHRGIRSGRRLAIESGYDEPSVLDWVIGRRVPDSTCIQNLAVFFGVPSPDIPTMLQRSERLMPARGRR